MWQLRDKELESVINLEGKERYIYFIKKVADQEVLWSLWQDDGWALAADPEGREAIPIWPHEKYAALCANSSWQGYEPRPIPLDIWLSRWIPGIAKDGRFVAVFPTIHEKGVFVSPTQMENDLRSELENYELENYE